MKWILIALGVLAGIIVLVYAIGAMLPRDHVATSRAIIPAGPADVYAVITDFERAPAWRTDVTKVERLSGSDSVLRWRESGSNGVITFEQVAADPPRRFESRIADPALPFGGTWIYEVAPAASGSVVTITERGIVYNPIFRFMSRFVFGHHATQQTYLRALGRRFGAEVTPERA
jgi:uncharacterized protein YndB with AHSA1/START domain